MPDPENYAWVQNDDGSVTVLDVEVMGVLQAGERKDGVEVVSADDLPKFLEITERIERVLKRRQTYLLEHNDYKNSKAADVIGYVHDRYIDGEWIKGKVTVTHPESIEKIKRGELPNRSPEFVKRGPNRGYMWALAATKGLPGHFDDRLPGMHLAKLPLTNAPELATLCADDELATCSLTAPPLTLSPVPSSHAPTLQPNTETGMPLSKEDLDALKGVIGDTVKSAVGPAVDAALDAKLKPLKDQVATLSAEPAQGLTVSPEDVQLQAKAMLKTEMDSFEKAKATNKLELERAKAMATLGAETSLTKAAATKYLENVPLDSIPFRVSELKARFGKRDINLGSDDDIAASGEMAALRKEFEEGGGEKAFGIPEREYCEMFAGKITDGLGE